MPTTTLSPAVAWVEQLLAARARVECYERGAILAYCAVLDQRPVYTGPLAHGSVRVDERDGQPVVLLEGTATAAQTPMLLAWIEKVLRLEEHP
jgi:hypothetical protein